MSVVLFVFVHTHETMAVFVCPPTCLVRVWVCLELVRMLCCPASLFPRVCGRHEKTQVKKENDRTRLTHMQNANAGPVFLTYRANERVDDVVREMTR